MFVFRCTLVQRFRKLVAVSYAGTSNASAMLPLQLCSCGRHFTIFIQRQTYATISYVSRCHIIEYIIFQGSIANRETYLCFPTTYTYVVKYSLSIKKNPFYAAHRFMSFNVACLSLARVFGNSPNRNRYIISLVHDMYPLLF